jgi:hypothetical protein
VSEVKLIDTKEKFVKPVAMLVKFVQMVAEAKKLILTYSMEQSPS